jgi:hypothetical protein
MKNKFHLINGIKQPWWSHFNSMHGIQSPIYFTFRFIYHKLYILCDFLQLWQYYAGTCMHKGQQGINVKANYEFGNDWKKMCFGTK